MNRGYRARAGLGAELALAGRRGVFGDWRPARPGCSCISSRNCRRWRIAAIIIGVIVAPEGATLEYTDGYARQLEQFYQAIPEVSSYFVFVAPGLEKPNPVNSAMSFVRLKPWEERQRKQQDIAKELAPKMFGGLPGVLAFPINPPSLGQSFRNPAVQFVIQANSYAELQTHGRSGAGQGAAVSRAWSTWIPTCA